MSIDNLEPSQTTPLLDPRIFADPYPIYHRLRSHDPVYWDLALNSWLVTSYSGVASLLRDPRAAAERGASPEMLAQWGLESMVPFFDLMNKMMLVRDPPDHTRLRGLVNKAFTPRVVESMRASIQTLVDELLDRVQPAGRMDVIADLGYPLPTTVIALMLGVPVEDRDQLKAWSDDFGLFIGSLNMTTEQLMQVQGSVFEFADYFRERIAEARANPRDDLLSAMATAEERGDMSPSRNCSPTASYCWPPGTRPPPT